MQPKKGRNVNSIPNENVYIGFNLCELAMKDIAKFKVLGNISELDIMSSIIKVLDQYILLI